MYNCIIYHPFAKFYGDFSDPEVRSPQGFPPRGGKLSPQVTDEGILVKRVIPRA